jgi:hypothetical protein
MLSVVFSMVERCRSLFSGEGVLKVHKSFSDLFFVSEFVLTSTLGCDHPTMQAF